MTRERIVPGPALGCLLLVIAGCASRGGPRERVTGSFPLAPQAQRAEPTLAVGDALRITVWRHPEFSGDFSVGRDSAVVHPLYQTVKVAGLPLGVARERIRALLAAYEQGVQLTVEPLWPVTVVGEVRAPNLYRLPNGTTVPQAVALAGGPTERGQLTHVRLFRPSSGAAVLDLLADARRADSVWVTSGDQLIVGRRREFNLVRDLIVPLASVTGAVAAVISVSRQR